MAYADQTTTELAAGGSQRLVELTDLAGSAILDSTVFAKIQTQVDAWIDIYCSAKHNTLPFDPVPPAIEALAAAEYVYRLKSNRQIATEEDHAQHDERVKLLESIRDGVVNPVVGDVYPIADGGGTPVATLRDDEENRVTRANLDGFV